MNDVGDATVCECGHRFDEHAMASLWPARLAVCTHAYGTKDVDAYGCECSRFQPAERELEGTALSQAVDRRRGL